METRIVSKAVIGIKACWKEFPATYQAPDVQKYLGPKTTVFFFVTTLEVTSLEAVEGEVGCSDHEAAFKSRTMLAPTCR